MKCPICGGELTPFDEKFVICDTCGAKIPADRMAPAVTEAPEPAPAEKTAEQKRLEELERRLNEMEEEKEKKEAASLGAKCKAAFATVGSWIKGHKKATAFSVLGVLVVITVIVLCVSLCGVRGVYVNENNPFEYYTFGVSSYTCTTPFLGEEIKEEGKYKISGEKIVLTIEDEDFGTISEDFDFKKVDGYSKISIGMDTYFRAGFCINGKVKIAFDANGGEGTDKIKVQLGKRIKDVPTVTRIGYRFVAWETEDGKPFSQDYPIWKNETYYAKWTECDHSEMKCIDNLCPTCQKQRNEMGVEEVESIPHHYDDHCICVDCQAVKHVYDLEGTCTRCGVSDVELSGTTLVGKGNFLGTNMVIPYGVTSIGQEAFYCCEDLTSVVIPYSVTSIEYRAFSCCPGLTSVVIPDSVTSIGEQAFAHCPGLTSVTIPDSVESIGNSSFSDCPGLTSLTIGRSVTRIDSSAFNNCDALEVVKYTGDIAGWCAISGLEGVMSSGVTLYINGSRVEGHLTIPDSVTSIGTYAFYNCTGLTSVTIPDGVTYIGKTAFGGCSSLVEMTIPFVGSRKKDPLRAYRSEDFLLGYFFGTSVSFQSFYAQRSDLQSSIPSSLRSITVTGGNIEDSAFYGCSMLTTLTFSDSVKSIGPSAFYNCTDLSTIYYMGDVAGWCSISGLSNLMGSESSARTCFINGEIIEGDIVIPNGVTSIGDCAFYQCSGLSSIAIPDSVTSIGNSAFYGCSGLASINIPAGVTSIGYDAFFGCSSLTSVEIPRGVTVINYGTFAKCSGLKSITIPYGVTRVSGGYDRIYGAFFGCSGLTSITIPDSVTILEQAAFSGCSGLTSITIPDSVTEMGDYAFNGCRGLISATIGNGVTNIGKRVFAYCNSLTSVTFGSGVTSIGSEAFYNCSSLTSISYTGNITSWCAISGLNSLMGYGSSSKSIFIGGERITGDLEIPNDVVNIGASAFSNCADITSVSIPDSVKNIGDGAFYGCTGLTTITIPDSVKNIGYGAFSGCTELTTITIPDSVTIIKGNLFARSGLTAITIPDSVTSIYDYAFHNCTGLTSITYQGTKTQWTAISKSHYWNNSTGKYTIHCTDGDIAKQ